MRVCGGAGLEAMARKLSVGFIKSLDAHFGKTEIRFSWLSRVGSLLPCTGSMVYRQKYRQEQDSFPLNEKI